MKLTEDSKRTFGLLTTNIFREERLQLTKASFQKLDWFQGLWTNQIELAGRNGRWWVRNVWSVKNIMVVCFLSWPDSLDQLISKPLPKLVLICYVTPTGNFHSKKSLVLEYVQIFSLKTGEPRKMWEGKGRACLRNNLFVISSRRNNDLQNENWRSRAVCQLLIIWHITWIIWLIKSISYAKHEA